MAAPDLFDAYFRRADTDRDGRISGQEAVAFFQGANLNREVLAKIWQYADQGQTGFLSRAEFYNALKLVTVAQTGRELTPAIVSRALHGPAAAQIPAPQIQVAGSVPAPQPVGAVRPGPVRPLGPPSQQFPQYTTPAAAQPALRPGAPTPQPRPPALQTSGGLTGSTVDWPTNKSSSWPGPATNNNLSGQNAQAKPPTPVPSPSVTQDLFGGNTFQAGANSVATKAPPSSSAEPDLFGGDVFTALPVKAPAIPAQTQQNVSAAAAKPLTPLGAASQPLTSAPLQRGFQPSVQPDQSTFALVPSTVPTASATPNKQIQPVAVPTGGIRPGFQRPGLDGTGPGMDVTRSWPKMSDSVVRRYTKIFFEVDTDKDGKISGNQARDLFLSWHLPREVLKQVWDLADQDHDSMLSLREFCTALYLMERFREGRPLSAASPSALYFDESGVQALRLAEAQVAVNQNSAGYNLPAWQNNPSVLQPTGPGVPGGLPPRPVLQGQVRPPMPIPAGIPTQPVQPAPGPGGVPSQSLQPKSKAPVLEKHLVNQLNADDQLTLQTKHQEAVDAEKKVQELEKEIMDSKEKMEYYRTKLQDIVLFKTRCDNRLAEITERAAADKREVESLAKRYDEKFKQAGESQSRLLTDEAAFRDVQERRLELYNAILRMEQGGDTNALLQSRADRLQNDLDELRKALNGKCKQLGLRIKPTSILELPFGWQPGIQENAAQWEEDWDKFEDEGFVYVQEFMEEGTAGGVAAKPKSVPTWDGNGMTEDGLDLSGDAEVQSEEAQTHGNAESASPPADSDDETTRNGDSSPHHDASPSSPQHSDSGIFSNANANSKESHSGDDHETSGFTDAFGDNGGDWASAFSHRSDDLDSNVSWGTSDNNKGTVETGFQAGKSTSASFAFSDPFDMLSSPAHHTDTREDFPSLGPIRTKETSVFFDASVPSTPLHTNASSTRPSSAAPFDNYTPTHQQFARFDSFSSNANDFGHSADGSFARFDSFSSVRDSGPARGFTSFDESDPFSGTGPFGGGQTPKRSTDAWSAFS